MAQFELSEEEQKFLYDAVLAVRVGGSIEDVVQGRMTLTPLAQGLIDKLKPKE